MAPSKTRARSKPAIAKVSKSAKSQSSPNQAGEAAERVWQVKLGSSSVYERFLCGGHLVYWTGSAIVSVALDSGRAVAKAKAESGAPWAHDDEVWIPTPKGFEARTPGTLQVTRAIAVPIPASAAGPLRLIGAAARIHGRIAYRIARTKKPANEGGALIDEYYLYAYDLEARQQRYLQLLERTSFPQVSGICAPDQFAIKFRTEQGFKIVFGSAIDGSIAGTTALAQSKLSLVGPHLIEHGVGNPLQVLRHGVWSELACRGDIRQIGDRLYCIGHRELVALDDELAVTARARIETPQSEWDEHRGVPTSACRVGSALIVVERRDAIANTLEPSTAYRYVERDPVSLRERAGGSFAAPPGLDVIGHVDGVYVGSVVRGFAGLRLRA